MHRAPWTDEDMAALRAAYRSPRYVNADKLAASLNRSPGAVYMMAWRHGLTAPIEPEDATVKKAVSCRHSMFAQWKREALARKITISELIRRAMHSYLSG